MKKVITYGTFDLFHRGHYNILKRAKELGDYLIVGVTSESFDIERGKLSVQDNLSKRMENVRNTGFADEIIIEEFQGQKVRDVQKYGIDIFAIGSDWTGKFEYLRQYCEVVYLERTKDISSTQLRRQQQHLHMGIVLNDSSDDKIVLESKYVSGVHIDSVFHENIKIAQSACESYELAFSYSDIDNFLNNIDAVYICRGAEKYIKPALLAGKHVLCSFPVFVPEKEFQDYICIARENNIVFLPYIKIDYLQAVNQMLWLLESGVIGNVLNVRCAITSDCDLEIETTDKKLFALYVYYKTFRGNVANKYTQIKFLDNSGFYFNLFANTGSTTVTIEISDGVAISNELTITGDSGIIRMYDDWWNTGYFEITNFGTKIKRRYCYNYEGTGMRFVLQQFLIMHREHQLESARFSYDDCIAFIKLYKEIFQEN